jgi:hypothetical protein
MLHNFTVTSILPTNCSKRGVFLVALIISLIHHGRYVILETDRVVRRNIERFILDTVLQVSFHINLIQDSHRESGI